MQREYTKTSLFSSLGGGKVKKRVRLGLRPGVFSFNLAADLAEQTDEFLYWFVAFGASEHMFVDVESGNARPDGIRDHKWNDTRLKCIDEKPDGTQEVEHVVGKASHAKRAVFVGHECIQHHKC